MSTIVAGIIDTRERRAQKYASYLVTLFCVGGPLLCSCDAGTLSAWRYYDRGKHQEAPDGVPEDGEQV